MLTAVFWPISVNNRNKSYFPFFKIRCLEFTTSDFYYDEFLSSYLICGKTYKKSDFYAKMIIIESKTQSSLFVTNYLYLD